MRYFKFKAQLHTHYVAIHSDSDVRSLDVVFDGNEAISISRSFTTEDKRCMTPIDVSEFIRAFVDASGQLQDHLRNNAGDALSNAGAVEDDYKPSPIVRANLDELLEEHTGEGIRTGIAVKAMAAFIIRTERLNWPRVVDREDLRQIAINSADMADIMIDQLNKPIG